MPQNSTDKVAQRRATVAQLYLKGWTQQRIADQEGVTREQISLDLTEIRKDWEESTLFNFNEAKIQELAKIDHLESVAWQAWTDSVKPLKKSSSKMRGTTDSAAKSDTEKKQQQPKQFEQYNYTEERLPDPRYLQIVDRQIERRCKILGLDAPLKIAQTDTDGVNLKAAQTIYIIDTTGGQPVPAPDDDYQQ